MFNLNQFIQLVKGFFQFTEIFLYYSYTTVIIKNTLTYMKVLVQLSKIQNVENFFLIKFSILAFQCIVRNIIFLIFENFFTHKRNVLFITSIKLVLVYSSKVFRIPHLSNFPDPDFFGNLKVLNNLVVFKPELFPRVSRVPLGQLP